MTPTLRRRALAMQVAGILAATTAAAATRHAYTNDFSTRTSGPTPSGRWMVADYIPGALVRPVSSAGDAYNSATAYQDGWTMKAGYCRSTVTFTVADDGGNPGVLVDSSSSSYQSGATVAMQPLYNEFTNGVLKMSVDIRTPAQTGSLNPANNALALCGPVYRSTLDVAASTFSAPLYFGPASLYDNREGQTAWLLRAVSRGRNTVESNASFYGQYDSLNGIAAGSWVRYEAVIDIDAGTYTATFADLGTAHPTPDTAGSAPVAFRRWEASNAPTTFSFMNPLTEGRGGIAGLAFYVQGIKKAANASAAPMFDNIAVSWKAPGTEHFASVYENDFTTRRYRQVEPDGTTTGAYALIPTTNAVQSSFYERALIDNDYGINEDSARRIVPDGAPYAGQDGWRRIAGGAAFTMVNPNKTDAGYGWNNASVLRTTGSGKTGMIAAPLGTTVSSGKVRLYCDILMGALTNSTSQSRDIGAAAFLAGDRAYTNDCYGATRIRVADITAALRGKGVCGAGTCYSDRSAGTYQTNTRLYRFNGSNYTTLKDANNSNVFVNCGRWGRYVVTLDLDAGTYDVAIYNLGYVGQPMDYDHSSSTVLIATNNLSLAEAAIRNVDSVVLFSEGQDNANNSTGTTTFNGKKLGRFPLFDNVRACLVNGDGTDGAELYSCNFEYGCRTAVRDMAELGGRTDREGADRWIRRGNAYGMFNVIDAGGGDSVLALDGFGWIENVTRAGYAVQPFGSVTKNSASVDFAADIRPPDRFARDSSCHTYVEVGGDDYAQGVYRPASSSSWRSLAPRIGFGFATGGGKDSVGQYTNVLVSVQSCNGGTAATTNAAVAIDTSHWYRFRVKAKPAALGGGTFTVKVYDQGALKPAASAADGAMVATFRDLALPVFGGEGMTTLGLAASGFAGTRGGGADDPGVALIDNLSATFNPAENEPAKRLGYIMANAQGQMDYIDLGVIAKSGTKMVAEMSWRSVSGTPVFCGAATNTSSGRFWLFNRDGNINRIGYGASWPYIPNSSYPVTIGEKYLVTSVFDESSVSLSCRKWDTDAGEWVAWGSVLKSGVTAMDTGLPLYLFADNVNGTAQAFALACVYSLKLWQRDDAGEWQLVRYLVPARMASGEKALYDRVTRGWFRNAADRAFGSSGTSDWSDGVFIRYR